MTLRSEPSKASTAVVKSVTELFNALISASVSFARSAVARFWRLWSSGTFLGSNGNGKAVARDNRDRRAIVRRMLLSTSLGIDVKACKRTNAHGQDERPLIHMAPGESVDRAYQISSLGYCSVAADEERFPLVLSIASQSLPLVFGESNLFSGVAEVLILHVYRGDCAMMATTWHIDAVVRMLVLHYLLAKQLELQPLSLEALYIRNSANVATLSHHCAQIGSRLSLQCLHEPILVPTSRAEATNIFSICIARTEPVENSVVPG